MGEIPENRTHAKSNNIFHVQATPPECIFSYANGLASPHCKQQKGRTDWSGL
jgi:hypothetical protein